MALTDLTLHPFRKAQSLNLPRTTAAGIACAVVLVPTELESRDAP